MLEQPVEFLADGRSTESESSVVRAATTKQETSGKERAEHALCTDVEDATRPRTGQKRKSSSKPTCRTQGQRRTDGGKKPILSPSPRPSPPTRSALRDRARHTVAQVTLKHSPQPSRLAAPRRRTEAEGVLRFAILLRTSMPSFDGLPGQSRRSLRFTHMLEPPHLTHTKTLLWWKILCPVWTFMAPRRGCKAHSCTSSPLSKTACHASFWGSSSSYWVSASSLSKPFTGKPGGGNPSGSRMKSAAFARHGTLEVGSQTRNCFLPQPTLET